MPLKFCTVQGNAEQPNFPLGYAQWLIFTCIPNYFLIALCGIALIAAALLYKLPKRWLPVLPWLLFLLAGAWSLFNSTELEYARHWLEHFAGAAALCAAVWIGIHNDEKLSPALMRTIGIVGLLCALHGWYQHFIGLEENRRFTMEQAAQGAMKLSDTLIEKLKQTRIYGTFADPNVYAANLLFCMPFSLKLCRALGHRFEKPRAGAIGAISVCIILYTCALFWSGSRGAAFGAIAGIGLWLYHLLSARSAKWRILLPAGAVLLAIAMLCVVSLNKSRGGLSTASARLYYYQAAMRMAVQHPLFGVGIGEYFPTYMQLKPIAAEITREPHSLPLALLSQCGIAGALAAICFYLFPWLLFFHTRGTSTKERTPFIWVAAAICAWSVHCLFQFNELVPGTTYLVALSFALMLPTGSLLSSRRLNALPLLAGICMFLPLRYLKAEYLLQINDHSPDALVNLYTSMPPYSLVAPRLVCDANLYKMEPLFYQQNWQRALQAAQMLTSRAPHRTAFHLREAKAQFALGNTDAALQAAQRSIDLAPTQAEGYAFMALLQSPALSNLTNHEKALLLRSFGKMPLHLREDDASPYIAYETDDLLIDSCFATASLPFKANPAQTLQFRKTSPTP